MVPCCHGARQKELTPGGNESRGGLVPLDLCTREALDFKVKLPEYTAVHGGGVRRAKEGAQQPGTCTSGTRRATSVSTIISYKDYQLHFDKSAGEIARLLLTKSNSSQIDFCFWQANKMFLHILVKSAKTFAKSPQTRHIFRDNRCFGVRFPVADFIPHAQSKACLWMKTCIIGHA